MSVSSAANSKNILVCSYRTPDDGPIDPHEDLIIEKEADIYLIQAQKCAFARIIISRLELRGYLIYTDEPGVFVALQSKRFKLGKATYRIGGELVSITAFDSLTGVRVRATSGLGNAKLDILYKQEDKDSNDLVVLAAPINKCADFDERYEKIFEPLDVGNLLVRTPTEEPKEKFQRVFHQTYRFDKVERLQFDEYIRATFCVIHWGTQEPIV